MRRLFAIGSLATFLTLGSLAGCSREPRRPADPAPDNGPAAQDGRPAVPAVNPVAWKPFLPEPGPQEKYDAALLEAINRMAEQNYREALAALETARAIQDTEQVRREIERLKALLAQQAAAERTLQSIQAVLEEGKPAEASRLAGAALQQYGGTDAAERLARLKRQADALVAVQLNDDTARRDRFRIEGEEVLRDRNLRAAVLAFEQALQFGDDAGLRKQLDAVRADLARYDDNRRRGAELRRDAANLEDALAAFQEAARAWETPQVRQEIDECTLALQKRRDRLGVADFEVRGEAGLPAAGRVVADELLPAFKARFDLVERGQLAKVVQELKLQAGELADNADGRREVGRLAKLRYLVVGSITPLGGVTVHARLIDVRTGLVVQTGRVSAPSLEELRPLLPELAALLQMSDEQRIAHERRLAEQADIRPVEPAPLPPPPVIGQPAPPPVIIAAPRPPRSGPLRAEDFDRLPPPPPPGQPPPPVIVVEREQPVKLRLLQVAVELGDNSFRRGRYREAHAHFELAFSLFPDNPDLRVRLDRCRPHLPPPPVVAPPPPRLAVLSFAELGDPRGIPPGLGAWTAEHIAPYFGPEYEVVERDQVFWYMGRLNMTLADVMNDPSARRWLGRALDARCFLFGTVRTGAGLDVTTHLVDAEHGFQVGGGRVHVHDPGEMKLRLPELARLTLLGPRERDVYVRDVDASRSLLLEARRHSDRGDLALSLQVCERALKLRPDSVEVQVFFQKTRDRARLAELEEARRWEDERRRAIAAELERRQIELAREAEAARRRAEQEAAARAEAERRHHELHRDKAHSHLLVQGRVALEQENFGLAIQFFESAVSLKRTDDAARELALARARAAEKQARREADLRRQREAELAEARARLDEERRRREAEEKARREAREKQELDQYTRLLDQAQRLSAQEKHEPAITALQEARRLRKTDEVERLLGQALAEQARAAAAKKDAQTRAELERKLEEERKRREQADARRKDEEQRAEQARAAAEAERKKTAYGAAMRSGRAALAARRHDEAVKAFTEAVRLFPTDADATGLLKQAEKARDDEAREAAVRKQQEERRKAEYDRLMKQGRADLTARRYEEAAKAFGEAAKLQPGDAEATKLAREANQALEASKKKPDPKPDPKPQPKLDPKPDPKPAAYARHMEVGAAFEKQQKYAEALKAYREALRLVPNDAKAAEAIKAIEFKQHLADGQKALKAKRFAEAAREFEDALKLFPDDADAKKLLKQARDKRP